METKCIGPQLSTRQVLRSLPGLAGIALLAFAIGPARADATSCQTTCPKTYTQRPVSVYLHDFMCVSEYPPGTPGTVSDTTCWRQALACAYDPASTWMGTVVATAGVQYLIDDTLCVKNSVGGVIDGNSAKLFWIGANAAISPMWYFENTGNLKFENLSIQSDNQNGGNPLNTALLFGSAGSGVGSGNVIEHVNIEGTVAGGLQYGIRFAGPSSDVGPTLNLRDANNDESKIRDSYILNVSKTAISIEHSQSVGHHIENVFAGGAFTSSDPTYVPVPGTIGVDSEAGSFEWVGGGLSLFDDANFVVGDNGSPIHILHADSEWSHRLLRTPTVNPSYSAPVLIQGGRFAVPGVRNDGDGFAHVIDYYRRGPLVVEELHVDLDWHSTLPAPVVIHFAPDGGDGMLVVNSLDWGYKNAASWDPIRMPNGGHLVSMGNHCEMDFTPPGQTGAPLIPCIGLGGGMLSTSGLNYLALSGLTGMADGHSAYCSNCTANSSTGICTSGGTGATARRVNGAWLCDGAELRLSATQPVSNKTFDSSNSFPAALTTDDEWNTTVKINNATTDDDFATLTGSQSITHKTLTDSTNQFPGLGILSFQGTGPTGTGTTYFTAGGVPSTSEPVAEALVPGLTAKKLLCRANTAALTSAKRWDVYVRKNAGDSSSVCSLNSAAGTCSVSASAAFNGTSDLLDLRVTAVGSPPTSTAIVCTVSAGF